MPKLFLLDGMALLYRAHFAFITRPIMNSKGLNTSALFGFTNTLLDLLNKQQPSHLAVAFDTHAPTARHIAFPAYKAQREETPEDILIAVPKIKELLAAFNIPVLELDGFEADDIIGTLARRAEREGFTTYMVTPDKDFAQLVDEKTFIYKPGRQGDSAEILGLKEIREKWGISNPSQVIDILGLWGDASDNIPGVPGVGEKTAQKLIAEFGSVENLLANTGKLKGKQKENFEKFAEQARISKELATINCKSPIPVSIEKLVLRPKNEAALKSLFIELEFNAFGKRLFGENFKAGHAAKTQEAREQTSRVSDDFQLESESDLPVPDPGQPETGGSSEEAGEVRPNFRTIRDVPHEYKSITTQGERRELLALLKEQPVFAFDTETSGLDPREAILIGISFSFQAGTGCFVHFPEKRPNALAVLEEFRGLFENSETEKAGHNLKFDLSILSAYGLQVQGPLFDTMIAHALIEPEQRHNLNALSEIYLGYSPVPITALIGEKGEQQKSMLDADKEALTEYAAEDADIAWQLREKFIPLLKQSGQEKVFYQVEAPLIPVLVSMEAAGVAIDIFALEEFSQKLAVEMDRATQDVYKLAGHEFNLNSPKQLGVVLFDELKIAEKPKKTKTGQYTTNEQVLLSLSGQHKIVERLLDYREATKLKSTYVDALPNAVSPRTGRVHTTYSQAATSTGRLASANPNLQNIPIRTDMGREIRKAFISDPRLKDFIILSADYSQIELRIIAALSGDKGMISAFEKKIDIHSATAARVFGVELDQVSGDMRRKAKMVNFGIAYGISAFGLAQRLGISRTEAGEIISQYNRQFPGVQTYMDETIEFCRKNGFVETITGRRRYLRDIHSANATIRNAAERNAINMPIQGTAADMIKMAMAGISREFRERNLKSRMLLQVHDELVFELQRSEEAEVRERLEHCMKTAITLAVPIEVEIGTGKNWLEAH
ncbi:MAG: DNA polymerase I [Methylacidiphilales bacterium]|nr:DNA polymerase I [Candidatus Methylacidiphilales bacterium]